MTNLGLAQRRNFRKKTGCTLRATPIFPEPTTRTLPYSLQSPKPQRPEQPRLHPCTRPASSDTRDPGSSASGPMCFPNLSVQSFLLSSQPPFSNENTENVGWGIGSPRLSSGDEIAFTLGSLWQNQPFHSLAFNMRLGRGERKSQKVGLRRTHCLSLCVCVCVCVCVCARTRAL